MKTVRKNAALSKFSIIALLAVLFCGASLRAERPPFKIYTTQDGLAHDSINRIVRDSRGFLWFCTAEGLSRFDGSRFVNFTQDQGLPNRNVTDFLETRDGTILLGTGSGLVVFNPNGRAYRWNVLESKLEQNGAEPPMFQTFAPDTDVRQKKQILSLAEDADGNLWAGMAYGLYRIEKTGDGWRFEEFEVEKKTAMNFNRLVPDAKGGLIVIASGGLYRLFRGATEKFDYPGAYNAIEDREGRIWVSAGGDRSGLRVYEFAGEHLRQTQSYTKKDGLTDDSHLRTLFQTSDGKIYVGGDANGLSEFVPDAKPNEPRFRSLSSDSTMAFAEDSAGNLWLGTELKGAWKLAKSGFFSFGEKEGVSESADIRSIYAARNGEIFLTVQPNKLLRLAADGKFETIVPFGLKTRNWGWNFLDFQARDGEWWIPSIDGLRRFPKVKNAADLARTAPQRIYTKTDGLWTSEIFNIFEDSRGDIWTSVSTNGEDTLSRWERETDKIYSYSAADNLPRNNGAISFTEDSGGDVWLGHYFGGLARWRDGKFQLFGAKDGLPESQIGDLHVDSSGRLWIATSGRGAFRVDEPSAAEPSFKSISTLNGLSSNQIICLAEDRFHRIYLGTGHGINRIDENGNVKVFTQADGLPSNYITRCAADANGFLWFVSRNALVRYQPEIERSVPPPIVYIDKISVGGVAQKISALGETEINLPELAPDQHQVQIDFFALTFDAGENIRYQYRLDAADWSNPTEQQTLNLDLSAGKHDFAVRAVRSDGSVSQTAATASFQILPPVWARPWFVALASLFALTVFFGFYRYRTARLREINAALTEAHRAEEELYKAREERLIELEKVRARIATDLHDDIGASLTQIAILSEVARQQARNGNGAIAKPLKEISSVSNELVGTMSDIVWSINPAKDHFSDLTQRMRRFASDVLTAKNINLQFHAPPNDNEITVNSNVRREVFLIYKECVNNIVKHSGATRATVSVGMSGADLLVEIADDGRGFATESNADEPITFGLGGNGIPSMTRRAEEMNGSVEIVSAVGKGTIVKLRLPLEIAAAQTGGDREVQTS